MLRGEKLLYEYRANLRGVHYLSNRAISGGRCQCSLHLEILPQGIRVEDEDYLSCSNATPAMYPLGLMMAGAFRISSGEVLLLPCLLQSRWLYQR